MGGAGPTSVPGPGGDAAKETIDKEATKFARTLRNGVEHLQHEADAAAVFDGDLAFLLADTLGYPVELSAEEAARIGMPIADGWQERYERAARGAAGPLAWLNRRRSAPPIPPPIPPDPAGAGRPRSPTSSCATGRRR